MLALARIDADLFAAGIDGGPVAWLHDEIVAEVPEVDAEEARRLLVAAMTDAFAETFPGAPLNRLVDAKIGLSWADAKEEPAAFEAPARKQSAEVMRLKAEGKSASDIVKALRISRASVFRIIAENAAPD